MNKTIMTFSAPSREGKYAFNLCTEMNFLHYNHLFIDITYIK